MNIPAAQIDLHHAYPRLNQPPGDEKALAPLFMSVALAYPLRLLAEIKRIVSAGLHQQGEAQRLMTMRVPRCRGAGLLGAIDAAVNVFELLQQANAVAQLRYTEDRTA